MGPQTLLQEVDRTTVIALLVARGDLATAAEARLSLPRTLDPHRDELVLHRFGVRPDDLPSRRNKEASHGRRADEL